MDQATGSLFCFLPFVFFGYSFWPTAISVQWLWPIAHIFLKSTYLPFFDVHFFTPKNSRKTGNPDTHWGDYYTFGTICYTCLIIDVNYRAIFLCNKKSRRATQFVAFISLVLRRGMQIVAASLVTLVLFFVFCWCSRMDSRIARQAILWFLEFFFFNRELTINGGLPHEHSCCFCVVPKREDGHCFGMPRYAFYLLVYTNWPWLCDKLTPNMYNVPWVRELLVIFSVWPHKK